MYNKIVIILLSQSLHLLAGKFVEVTVGKEATIGVGIYLGWLNGY